MIMVAFGAVLTAAAYKKGDHVEIAFDDEYTKKIDVKYKDGTIGARIAFPSRCSKKGHAVSDDQFCITCRKHVVCEWKIDQIAEDPGQSELKVGDIITKIAGRNMVQHETGWEALNPLSY